MATHTWLADTLRKITACMGVGKADDRARCLPTDQSTTRSRSSTGYEGLFEGEVFTRAFSPLLGIGALSPRYVAAKLKERGQPRFLGKSFDPEITMLEEVSAGAGARCLPCLPVWVSERRQPYCVSCATVDGTAHMMMMAFFFSFFRAKYKDRGAAGVARGAGDAGPGRDAARAGAAGVSVRS